MLCVCRDFVGLRATMKALPHVALSPAWDALSKAQSVRHRDRYETLLRYQKLPLQMWLAHSQDEACVCNSQ